MEKMEDKKRDEWSRSNIMPEDKRLGVAEGERAFGGVSISTAVGFP
jgi:hypothetical protein